VYLDRRSLDIDPRALVDCRNIRIKNGSIRQEGLGWENFPRFATDGNRINLDGQQVLFVDNYTSRAGASTLIFCNQKDVFRFNQVAGTVTYLTPRYETGTCSAAGGGTEVIGIATTWKTAKTTLPIAGGYGDNVKPGYEIHFGATGQDDPGAEWWEIDTISDNLTLDLLSDPGAKGSGSYTIRQTLSSDNNDIFDSAIFVSAQASGGAIWASNNDIYYMTNGLEMLEWDGSADQMVWFYPGFVAKGLRAYKQVLVAWNVLEGGNQKSSSIRYTQLLYPRNFTDQGAGEIKPADGIGDLHNVIPLGDQAGCYFNGDIVLIQYVGAPLYFIARVAVPGVGLLAPRAIMDFGDYHEFLSRDSSYRFDGVTLVPSMHQVFREVLRTAHPNRSGHAYCYMDEENGEVIWSLPLNADGQDDDQPPTTAYVQHYLEDIGPSLPTPMTIRDFPFTALGEFRGSTTSGLLFSDYPETPEGTFAENALQWDDRTFSATFPFVIAGDANGDVWILNTQNTQDGVGFASFARFPRVALGNGDIKGLVRRIEPHTTRRQGAGNYPLNVTLRIFDFVDGDEIQVTTEEFGLTHQGLRYVPVRAGGRFGEVEFGTDGVAAGVPATPWDLSGYGILVDAMGSR
jgi:hypothetical protein